MKKIPQKNKFSYEPEADVLTLEISSSPIDHARELGPLVVHFTKRNVPVLVEILEASKFLRSAEKVVTATHAPVPQLVTARL